MPSKNPGELCLVFRTAVLYGPVIIAADGLIAGKLIGNFHCHCPAIVITIITAEVWWMPGDRVKMIYIVTPDKIGWTWEENVQ